MSKESSLRERAAIAAMHAILVRDGVYPSNVETIPDMAIQFADALLKRLKETHQPAAELTPDNIRAANAAQMRRDLGCSNHWHQQAAHNSPCPGCGRWA